jgi:geranylgeranyl diphosphate synthase, type II
MFKLSDYLDARRAMIELALGDALPKETTAPLRLHEAMRYSVLSGGKRLRPILAIAAAECVGADAVAVVLPAIAVELLHTYTLIHDDLPCMDDDDERRGKPTSHKVFGEANAILAGDALQALAFELAAQAPAAPDRVVIELAQAAGSLGVVGGQVADIAAGDFMTLDELEFIHQHKTADLFRAAIRMGAIAGGTSETQLADLTTYGANLGLAFQIIDDILDTDDLEDDSCSCIGLYGIEEARRRAKSLTDGATEALKSFGDVALPLAAIARHMLERTY